MDNPTVKDQLLNKLILERLLDELHRTLLSDRIGLAQNLERYRLIEQELKALFAHLDDSCVGP